MTRDRLSDLYAARKNSLTKSNSLMRNLQLQIKQDKNLHELLKDVEETRDLINEMTKNINKVKSIQNDVLLHTNQAIQKELETRTYTINQLAHRIYNKLKGINKHFL